MKRIVTLFIYIAFLLSVAQAASPDKKVADGITLFAVASLPQGEDQVYLSDSVIVTITLYSNVNFENIKNKSTKQPSVKHATVHRYRPGRRLSQDVAIYQGKRYYAVAAVPFGRSQTQQVKKSCSSAPLKIKVTKRPRKTILELQQSGAMVM